MHELKKRAIGRRIGPGLLLALAAWSGVLAGDTKPAATPYPEDAPVTWDRLFDARDVEGLAEQYADSTLSMPFGAASVRGRKAMTDEFARFFKEHGKATHKTRVVELLQGNGWAVERADYTLTFTPNATGKEIVETGRHVVCRKWDGKAWMIAWELWNSDQPTP